MAMAGNIHTPTATERLARKALELHRLAITAGELRCLPSPAVSREKNAKGAADPTANTVMDERRKAVASALDAVTHDAETLMHDHLSDMTALLRSAVDGWDA